LQGREQLHGQIASGLVMSGTGAPGGVVLLQPARDVSRVYQSDVGTGFADDAVRGHAERKNAIKSTANITGNNTRNVVGRWGGMTAITDTRRLCQAVIAAVAMRL